MQSRETKNHKTLASLLVMMAYLLTSAAYAQQSTTVTKVTLVMTDAQGNVLMTTDVQGNITARYTYRPYGTQQSGPTNAGPGYTGHVNDPDTGLVYMQQRYYDPVMKRFISPDPITPTPGNIYNFNRYAYANNNPIRNIDPFGLYACGAKVSGDDCKKIDGYVNEIHQSLKGLKKGSAKYVLLHNVAKFLGSKDDDNGVTIITANLSNGSEGSPGGLKTVNVDIANIEKTAVNDIKPLNPGMSNAAAKLVEGGSTVAHETQHLLDANQKTMRNGSYLTRGFPTSKAMETLTETNAYQIDSIYGKGLGVDVGYSTPSDINAGVAASVKVWCSSHGCN